MRSLLRFTRFTLPCDREKSRPAVRNHNRKGNIILLSAGVMVMVMAFAAFTIDIGYIAMAKGQLQSAVDAATLAGAMELNPHEAQSVVKTNVETDVVYVAGLNEVGGSGLVITPSTDVQLGRRDWNSSSQSFVFDWTGSAVPYNVVKVHGTVTLPLFFAPTIGHKATTLTTASIATYQPRDIMLVLDYSGSMNNDTEFGAIPSLGQTTIEDAIDTMWDELGNPSYGTMPYTPTYLDVDGVPENVALNIPHVDITYKGKSIDVTSTLDLIKVTIRDQDGQVETFAELSGLTGTFADGNNRQIKEVWVESGSNSSLSEAELGEKFDFYNSDIAAELGLPSPYPHPSGSWADFVNYVNTDGDVNTAGYRYKYGTMCLINYWNERKPKNSQTTTLWQITTQPLSAAKNASDALIDYINDVEAEDRVGLSIYTHTNSDGAILESGLTDNLLSVKPLYRDRQAGHYDNMTNIGGGIKVARDELLANGRPHAVMMMVVITDGVANRPSGNANGHAMAQASLCGADGIKIMTVSLGLGADQTLMQNIADTTGGIHFNVPGGGTIAQYEQQLMDVFASIAANRPLKLLPAQ